MFCKSCGSPVGEGARFCKHCGNATGRLASSGPTPNVSAPSAPMPHPYGPASVAVQDSGGRRAGAGRIAALAAASAAVVLAIAAIVAGAVYVYRLAPWDDTRAIEARLDDAIAKDQLLTPSGTSARDLYAQLKAKGLGPDRLARFEQVLLAKLTTRPEQMLHDVTMPAADAGTPEEWTDAGERLAFACEINPADKALAARSAYCLGRAAYARDQKDAALDAWRQAADLDPTWALPANGVGLVYNERKNYDAARQYLFEATKREPSWALPYNNIGTSYFFEGNVDEAERYYRKAVELDAAWPRPHAWLGDIAMRRKQYAAAAAEYQSAIDLDAGTPPMLDHEALGKKADRARELADLGVEEGC